MRKRILWVAAALVLIAIPAVIGLVALRGDDDSSSEARRAAALMTPLQAEQAGATTIVMKGGKSAALSGKEIAIESFSWGVANNATAVGAGTGAGKANFNDISFTKLADESSPGLMQSCASGEHFTEVIINVRKPPGSAKGAGTYMTITMSDALISSYQQSGSGGSELPTESISLNFAQIKVTYDPAKAGTSGSPQMGSWDLRQSTS